LRKVFEVELSSKNGCTELALPATRYALLDAVEKLELREGERPDWEILQTPACHNIYPYLDPAGGTLSELNALTQRLAQLNEREHAVVEGLAKLAHEQGERPIALSRLIDLAYSTDCCHLVEGVVTDAQLGRFCAEKSFVPGAEDLPDSLFELLDTAGMDCRRAISSELTDYEDAMIVETALRCGVDCIVTRNLKDYERSPVQVYSPSAFLARIEEDSEKE